MRLLFESRYLTPVIASEAKQSKIFARSEWIASSLRSLAQTLAFVAGNDGGT
jgi:hypothetical protein